MREHLSRQQVDRLRSEALVNAVLVARFKELPNVLDSFRRGAGSHQFVEERAQLRRNPSDLLLRLLAGLRQGEVDQAGAQHRTEVAVGFLAAGAKARPPLGDVCRGERST